MFECKGLNERIWILQTLQLLGRKINSDSFQMTVELANHIFDRFAAGTHTHISQRYTTAFNNIHFTIYNCTPVNAWGPDWLIDEGEEPANTVWEFRTQQHTQHTSRRHAHLWCQKRRIFKTANHTCWYKTSPLKCDVKGVGWRRVG